MTDKEMQVQRKREVQQAGEPTKPMRQYVPAVDIFETDRAVTVRAEMPGVSKNGVEINLEDGTLTIEGTRLDEVGDNEKMLLTEYETGRYIRKFTVSETIDQEKIEASITDGILTVILPKIEPVKPRRVEVKAG